MQVRNFSEIEQALSETRGKYRELTDSVRAILDDAVGLYFKTIGLIRKVANDADDEKYAMEVFAVAFRRILSSLVLLESGLPQEAHIVLRNALELMLIGVDITYNPTSLAEWKKTIKEEDSSTNYDDWYFKKSKMCKRIEANEGGCYPELERQLSLGDEGKEGRGICKEWEFISSASVHAHSQKQIRRLFNEAGDFRLLGLKTTENYEKDFRQYRIFIFSIITLLLGIPRYHGEISKRGDLSAQANEVAGEYAKLQKEIGALSK